MGVGGRVGGDGVAVEGFCGKGCGQERRGGEGHGDEGAERHLFGKEV